MEDKLLDAQVVAKRLGVSRTTVYNLMKDGILEKRCVGVKKGYRIPESSLKAFMDGSRQN